MDDLAEKLADAEERFRLAFDRAPTGMVLVSLGGRFQRVNDAVCRMLGYPRDLLLTLTFAEVTHPADVDADLARVRRVLHEEIDSYTVEKRYRHAGGHTVLAQIDVSLVRGDDGGPRYFVVQMQDITERRAAEEALRASQARFEALVERSADGICVVDAQGRITFSSPAGTRLLGYDGSPLGHAFLDRVHPDEVDVVREAFATLVRRPGATATGAGRLRRGDGAWRHVEVVATNRLADPAVAGVVANLRDVTDRAEVAAQLTWQAFHDPLTGLPNRLLLMERLERTAAQARDRTAVLFVDLDRFKLVNDTLGHDAGDQVLVEVGRRIVRAVRSGDMVSRHGGDEFMVVTGAAEGTTAVMATAERIRAAIEAPVALPQGAVNITASIGVAFDAGQEPALLLRDADMALYRAKHRGKNRSEVFNAALRSEALQRIEAELVLRRALELDTLRVFHQPVVDLTSGQVVATEALLRLPGPDGTLLAPGPFIEVAEESGLIEPIGAQVLRSACRTLAGWRADGCADAPHHVAVNVSPRQLTSPTFVSVVRDALAEHGLEPQDLVLEFTEEAVIGAERAVGRNVRALDRLGVALAIDDFGTGYSSLSYLKRFPITWLKLDRSFVAGLGVNADDTEIVKAVVALGLALGLQIVAEGIEHPHQVDALRDLGCHFGQGYLFARPAPAHEVPRRRFAVHEHERRLTRSAPADAR